MDAADVGHSRGHAAGAHLPSDSAPPSRLCSVRMAQDVLGLVGTTIDGRYDVEAVVGEGGFAIVYRALHQELGERLAVKCLKVPIHFTAEARASFLEQFRREGRMLTQLVDHPSILRVRDFGTVPAGHLSIPYLVLEWLDGRDLEQELKERQAAFGEAEAVTLLRPAIEAVGGERAGVGGRDARSEAVDDTRSEGFLGIWLEAPRPVLGSCPRFGGGRVFGSVSGRGSHEALTTYLANTPAPLALTRERLDVAWILLVCRRAPRPRTSSRRFGPVPEPWSRPHQLVGPRWLTGGAAVGHGGLRASQRVFAGACACASTTRALGAS